MHTQKKQTRSFPRRLSTGLCWFIALQLFLIAPLKFSPVGILGWPSYPVKFVAWGYPAWFSPFIGACELMAAVLLTLPRRRFLGAVMLIAILTGAVTTHIVDHSTLADSIAALIELVLAGIAALTQWPADWREPFESQTLTILRRSTSRRSKTHLSSWSGPSHAMRNEAVYFRQKDLDQILNSGFL